MLERFRVWFVKGMKNGLKLQIAISILIFGAVLALTLQFHQQFQTKKPELSVLGISVNVPVQAGGPLIWSRTLCNSTDHTVDAALSLHLLHQDETSGQSEMAIPGSFTAVVPPNGCNKPVIANTTVPATVVPGTWQLRVIIEYTPLGGLLSLTSATSDPFEIKAAR